MPAKIKVLLIDDNPDFIEEITQILLKMGEYEVISTYDGLEGLEMVFSEKPDCIVLDVMLPNKDGYEVIEILKKHQLECYEHVYYGA